MTRIPPAAAFVAALVAALVAAAVPPATPAAYAATTPKATAPADQPADEPTDEPTEEPDDAVTVTLDAVGPPVVTGGSTVTVRATVTNGTSEPLADASVEVSVRRQLSANRSQLQQWVVGAAGSGRLMKTVPIGEPLAPGTSRAVDLSFPADQLNLTGASFGSRGLAVVVRDAQQEQLDITRSFVVWQDAEGGYEPTRITALLPLTGPPPDIATGRVPAAELARQTGQGGRLRTLLDAAAEPGVSWALDPALLEWADTGAQSTGASAEPTPGQDVEPALRQWRDDVQSAAAGHEVVALPYGDTDALALVHARVDRAYDLAEQTTRQTVQELIPQARTDVGWPTAGTLDNATLATMLDAGRTAVVLSGGAQPLAEDLRLTPTGRSTITVGDESAAGLLVDTQLSTTLARTGSEWAEADDDTAAAGDGAESAEDSGPAAAVQRLLAETAAITMERPFDPRHLLITAPRGWDPEPAHAMAAVRALTTAPWLDPRPLSDLRELDPPDVERGPLSYPEEDRADELGAAGLRLAAEATAGIHRVATMLPDPDALTAETDRSLVAASSAGWRGRDDDWTAAVTALGAEAQRLSSAVTVLHGSDVTVVSSDVQLPITIQNQLDQPASVTVRLRPRSSRLVVEQTQSVTVSAQSQQRLAIPVRAVGNGDTDVVVELLTPTGQPLGEPVTMRVRVRADWETVGTLVVGVLVGLVLVVGVVRGVVTGRRRRALGDPLADLSGTSVREPQG